MLKAFRKNTKVIVWTVVVSFALWGAYSVGTQFQKEGRVAGEVFGEEVNFQDFDRFYRANQIFSFTGKPIEDPEILKQQTWQSIIYWRAASRKKLKIADDAVRSEIKRLLAAEGIANVTPQLYQRWLTATVRETPQQFEKQIRELLQIQKLIHEIHDRPVDLPTQEEALRQFLLESQKLLAEVAQFDTFEQATNFYLKAKLPQNWANEVKNHPSLKVTSTGMISLRDLIREWQVSEEDAFKLSKNPKNTVTNAIPTGTLYSVFYLTDKQEVTKKEFTEELKDKYLKQLENERKNHRFFQWNLELYQKANLKDYLPRAETANPAT